MRLLFPVKVGALLLSALLISMGISALYLAGLRQVYSKVFSEEVYSRLDGVARSFLTAARLVIQHSG